MNELDKLRNERADILAMINITKEGYCRIDELDILINDISTSIDTFRSHELSVDKDADVVNHIDNEEDDYGDYEYGEVSISFKDPNMDY